MRKIVLTFGLIAGAVLSAVMLLTLPFQDKIGFESGAAATADPLRAHQERRSSPPSSYFRSRLMRVACGTPRDP